MSSLWQSPACIIRESQTDKNLSGGIHAIPFCNPPKQTSRPGGAWIRRRNALWGSRRANDGVTAMPYIACSHLGLLWCSPECSTGGGLCTAYQWGKTTRVSGGSLPLPRVLGSVKWYTLKRLNRFPSTVPS